MLVHFIGGPAHGRSEAIQNPQPIYRMVELSRLPIFAVGEYEALNAELPFEEHSYRITKRTPRYAIAEWEAPTVEVRFEVRLELDPFDRKATDALRKFFLERNTELKHGVRCVGAAVSSGIEGTVELVVPVEGPEDAVAIQIAAEKVQHYLDAELPPCVQHIRSVGAATS
jgi:hypothetical protein